MKKTKETELAEKIAAEVKNVGGECYYVGGFVRDGIMGNDTLDADVEVHGVEIPVLEKILDSFGRVRSVGESFGIYKIDGYELDIAMPRFETATGKGHRDLSVSVDPFAGLYNAAKRRDFTVNAIYENVLTHEITDLFGGCADIRNRILRHVSEKTFSEDPLRVLRGAQFCARFGLTPDEKTVELCKKAELSALPGERIDGELKKALLKSDTPSVFFEFLRRADCLDFWFPELKALIECGQEPRFHAEGDVWNHTMAVLDSAAKRREKVSEPYAFMLSALCHDFGKPLVTKKDETGRIRSIGHETAGIEPVKAFLRRIVSSNATEKYVINMVENHMRPGALAYQMSGVAATNRMFDASVDPMGLIMLSLSDGEGSQSEIKADYYEFLKERLNIYNEYMSRPFVTGKDLIANGIEPSKDFSEYLETAHRLRLSGESRESVLNQILKAAGKR